MVAARMKIYCLLMLLFVSTSVSQDYVGEQICSMSQATAVTRKFAYSLFNTASKLVGHRRNILVSPLAVGSMLSMISHGASGRTRNEIFKVLKQGERSEFVNEEEFNNCVLSAYHADRFNKHFILKDSPQRNTARLTSATRIFGDSNLTFDGDFVANTGLYGTEMAAVPILKATKVAERQINRWVNEQTNGNIKQIITRGSLQKSVKFITTSSIFFKGTWISPFLNASRDHFFIFNKRRKFTDFMTSRQPVKYLSSKELHAELVEIPYDVPDESNIDPSLILILPFDGTALRQVELGLKDSLIESLLHGNITQQIRIRIPKFVFFGSQKLKFFLKRMGVRDIFSPGRSQLRNTLLSGKEFKDRVYISHAEHKVRFEIEEYGSQGYVHQPATVADSPSDKILTFNRAYIFILYDKFTNTVVYIGRVSDPKRRL